MNLTINIDMGGGIRVSNSFDSLEDSLEYINCVKRQLDSNYADLKDIQRFLNDEDVQNKIHVIVEMSKNKVEAISSVRNLFNIKSIIWARYLVHKVMNWP